MAKAANLLPKTIEQATKGTPVAMLLQVVDRRNIEAFLAIELTKLASLINVDERLNLQSHQIPFIASQLIDLYRNETLADFKLCFERGAFGRYSGERDKLLRLDASVINGWMAKYLEEKYQVIEKQLMESKENPYEAKREIVTANPERNLLALFRAIVGDRKPEDVSAKDANEYERYKLLQRTLRKVTKEKYGDDLSSLDRYDDDQGYYVYAASIEDAEWIYNEAKNRMKS